MKAELVPENGDAPIPIDKDMTIVGRRGYCDVVVDHASLSKRHCVLVKTDGLLVIRDLASTNGTKVKGQKIRWAALLPDDRVTFGSYKVRIYLGPDDAPAPSEKWQKRKTSVAAARPAARADAASPLQAGEFPSPTPLGMPMVSSASSWPPDLGQDTDDSGWRNMIGDKDKDDDDIIIELD
ncbi:FHA domain-containing protein [Singulisphaera sp. PoT]|uniref:FHA domain-containing protein n=1 Tax=Singulisphaera sp. PoT TaxID=3411797 RepID=UPI003BF505DB